MGYEYQLAYENIDAFIAAIGPEAFRRGNRITVRLREGTSYVFTYISANGDVINGLSALNGAMIIIDLQRMTVIEQPKP